MENTWDYVHLGTILDHSGEVEKIVEGYNLNNLMGIKAAIRQAMWVGLVNGLSYGERKHEETKEPLRGTTKT